MSDYTPTTDDMRTSWHRNSMSYGPGERTAEFDRFIADVKADAWDEGYETGCSSPYGTSTPSGKSYDPEPNPYRER